MAFSDLEIFAHVAETGSLSAAARILGCTPAMVSKRLKNLEVRLGVRLIQRTTRSLTVTSTGEAFYERVTGILAAVREAESFVSGMSETPQGPLRICCSNYFGQHYLVPHLGAFLDRYPLVRIELELTDRHIDLVSERFDVGIRIGDMQDSSLIATRISSAHHLLCATPEYLARNGHPRGPQDLIRHKLLTTTSQHQWRLMGVDGPVTIAVESLIKTASPEVVRRAVLASLGIGRLLDFEVRDDLAAGRLVQAMAEFHPADEIGIHVVFPSRRQLAPSVRAFIRHVRRAPIESAADAELRSAAT